MPRQTSATMRLNVAPSKRFIGRNVSTTGDFTPQIQANWHVCPHRSMAGCCPMGMLIRTLAHVRSVQAMIVLGLRGERRKRIDIRLLERRLSSLMPG